MTTGTVQKLTYEELENRVRFLETNNKALATRTAAAESDAIRLVNENARLHKTIEEMQNQRDSQKPEPAAPKVEFDPKQLKVGDAFDANPCPFVALFPLFDKDKAHVWSVAVTGQRVLHADKAALLTCGGGPRMRAYILLDGEWNITRVERDGKVIWSRPEPKFKVGKMVRLIPDRGWQFIIEPDIKVEAGRFQYWHDGHSGYCWEEDLELAPADDFREGDVVTLDGSEFLIGDRALPGCDFGKRVWLKMLGGNKWYGTADVKDLKFMRHAEDKA